MSKRVSGSLNPSGSHSSSNPSRQQPQSLRSNQSSSRASSISETSTSAASTQQTPTISQSSAQSSRNSMTPVNERSNEVPPSSNSTSNFSTQNNAEPSLSTSITSAVNIEATTSNSNDFDSNEGSHSTNLNAAAPVDININSLNKKSIDNFFLNRIKKRPISGVGTDTDSELTCPICFDLIDVAHVTKCGHSFCQTCIQTALDHTHRCPKCNTPCSITKDVFPNFTLNQIIERHREDTNNKKCKFSQNSTSNIIDYINSAQEELKIDEVNQLLVILSQRKEELKYTNQKVTELLLHDFLKHLQQVKTEELSRIQHELQLVNDDCKQVEELINLLKSDKSEENQDFKNVFISDTLAPTDNISPSLKQESSEAQTTSNKPQEKNQQSPNKFQTILTNKKRIIHRYFDELSQTYVHSHNKDFKDFNLRDVTKNSAQSIVLEEIRKTVSKITNCSEFRCIASVNYNSDLYSLSSIVSSVDFDRSYEHFAMAGVTKRIKIFDFNNILSRPYGVHYPLYEMSHNAKLSCVSWNRYFRQQLACSDYEGVVTLWDAEAGSLIRSYQEHEKRCWSTQFCNVDPRLLCSASDDSKVKIWSTNSEYSLLSIDAKSNVCCCVFKPDSKFHVLFGTADHSIHYYDLRNPKEAISLYKGHKKAVSYVKFSGENQFVSASTDSTLKMWNLNEGQCTRTFTGHVNEKNFVGLETHNGYVITGSENNTCYLYCNELSKPMLSYKFDDGGLAKKDEAMNDFVSAVCWDNQNHLLAANSQGVVKVLELI